MRKYIDADWLIDNLYRRSTNEVNRNGYPGEYGLIDFIEMLNYTPAADVQEVVKEWCYERNCIIVAREDFPRLEVQHGYWELYDICSVCGAQAEQQTSYCPNCGSRMDLGGKNE